MKSMKNIKTSEEKELAQKYQKKTDKQHVLDAPDTYTGSMTSTDYDTFVYNNETNSISAKHITIVPGLYKIIDEAAVNTRDQAVRIKELIEKGQNSTTPIATNDVPVTEIDITLDETTGIVTLYNNGNGLDVAKHIYELRKDTE